MRGLFVFVFVMVTSIGYSNVSNDFVEVPDTTQSLVDKAKVKTWMADARHKMFENDWRGALALYREVLSIDPKNAKAEFRYAECQYHLAAYPFALEHLENAEKLEGPGIDKDFYYIKGLINYKLGNIDEAISAFEAFKTKIEDNKTQMEEYSLNKLLADAKFAKEQLSNPNGAKVTPFSDKVNTRYREYSPVVSPDGKKLYFTSRRNDTYGGGIAPDGVFFEDIYVSEWDDEKGAWKEADAVPGRVNNDQFESVSHIIDDDGTWVMYLTMNVEGYTKTADIAYSRLSDKGTWGKPKLLPKQKGKKGGVNSTFAETSASLTADGNTMYYVAEGLKGQGRYDIYRVEKNGSKWGVPVNLGDTLNTPDDENSVYVTPDGNHLFFSSNGHRSIGGYDIYVSSKVNGKWTAPKNLGSPINGVDDEIHFRLSPDGKKAYFSSIRDGGKGLHDIYEVDLSDLNLW